MVFWWSVLLQFWGSMEEARKGVGLDEGPLGSIGMLWRDVGRLRLKHWKCPLWLVWTSRFVSFFHNSGMLPVWPCQKAKRLNNYYNHHQFPRLAHVGDSSPWALASNLEIQVLPPTQARKHCVQFFVLAHLNGQSCAWVQPQLAGPLIAVKPLIAFWNRFRNIGKITSRGLNWDSKFNSATWSTGCTVFIPSETTD